MKKKFILYAFACIICLALLFAIHYLTKPEEMPVVTRNTLNGLQLSYDEVNEFVYQQNKEVYLFFYSSVDADSQFVIDNILYPILQENKMESFDQLYYVDLANLPETTSNKFTKNHWNFYNLPTFLSMKIENNEVKTADILEYDSTNPYSIETVKDWLKKHKITQN